MLKHYLKLLKQEQNFVIAKILRGWILGTIAIALATPMVVYYEFPLSSTKYVIL
jgi:hypothetical protein